MARIDDIKTMFHDYAEYYRQPSQIISSINTAKEELNYSNYDNHNLDIAIQIIEMFYKENNIPKEW